MVGKRSEVGGIAAAGIGRSTGALGAKNTVLRSATGLLVAPFPVTAGLIGSSLTGRLARDMNDSFRFLIVNTDYTEFMVQLYARQKGLAGRTYAQQHEARMETLFAVADSYSTNLQQLGHEAWDVIANLEPLQKQWARENSVRYTEDRSLRLVLRRGWVPWLRRQGSCRWLYEILEAQIKAYRPDVLYCLAMEAVGSDFLRSVRGYYRLAVGQHAAPLPEHDVRGYDLVLSSLPNQVDYFRAQGLRSERLRLAFEPRVLDRTVPRHKQFDVVFAGGLGALHEQGVRVLEQLCGAVDVRVWGYGAGRLPRDSRLRHVHQGQIWGLEMYQVLRDARIAFNRHIGVAGDHANNMRLYEATGAGTMLVTDAKRDLGDLYDVGKEVVAYRDANECGERVRYYLSHDREREQIAAAGQQRTLREHTYALRTREMVDIVGRYL